MGKGPIKPLQFKDAIVPTSSGASDYEGAQLVGGDLEINGQKPVILVNEGGGEGVLGSYLKELE